MAINKLPTSASLKEVMDKFEEISLQDFSSIDVITASELPVSGKEGQLCIITDTKPSSILFNYDNTIDINETEILILYNTVDSYQEYNINASNINMKLRLRYVIQKINGVNTTKKGYVYLEGKWKPLFPTELYIFKSGEGLASGVSYTSERTAIGSGSTTNVVSKVTQSSASIISNVQLGSNSLVEYQITFDKSNINFEGYKKLYIDLKIDGTGPSNIGNLDFTIQIVNPNTNSVVASAGMNKGNYTYSSYTYKFARQYKEINVEHLTGEHIIKFISYVKDSTSHDNPTMKTTIYNIVLCDEILA